MTGRQDYEQDKRALWDAIVVVGSITLATLTMLISHLLWGGKWMSTGIALCVGGLWKKSRVMIHLGCTFVGSILVGWYALISRQIARW